MCCFQSDTFFKGTDMQFENVLINDRLRVSKVPWKLPISTVHNFAVIYLWNLLFSENVAYSLKVFYCLFYL